jgi:cysteine desulfurase
MTPLYLDHHATTPCDPGVVAAMLPYFTEHFGNAGSRQHAWGMRAAAAVDMAREQVAHLIGAAPEEILFTSGATEADNLAIFGVARSDPRRHLVTVATEHHAVLDPMRRLVQEGWSLTEVEVGPDGVVDPDAVAAALQPDTALVSVMLGNNEIGAVHPVAEITRLARARGALVHTDAVQAAGRLPLDVRTLGVDLMSLTAHKMYGPKGIGALWVRRGRPRVALEPLGYGGGQERGLRSGTLPVPLIVGFGAAAVRAEAGLTSGEPARLTALVDRLWARLRQLDGVVLNGPEAGRLPGNLSVAFAGVTAAALMMELRPIAVSAGSACSTGRAAPSHVLLAIGRDPELARGTLRFGMGRSTTEDEVDHVADRVEEALRRLRG